MREPAILPQRGGRPFLIDGGLETRLIFKDGFDLPFFASFALLESSEGVEGLKTYYRRFLDIARRHRTGYLLEAPTWRASPDWGEVIGYDRDALYRANRKAIELLAALRAEESPAAGPIAITAAIGPRGDGYAPGNAMSGQEARDYHRWQLETIAEAGADMATALTMNHAGEAEGIAWAAADIGLPVAVSFTVETDGRLPTGMSLADAVARVDDRAGDWVSFYMVNCAHPSHFAEVLWLDPALASRIGGIRANASRMSHAELDEAAELDEGNPAELAEDYRKLLAALPSLCLLGGCCGTDHTHVGAIADLCAPILSARVGH